VIVGGGGGDVGEWVVHASRILVHFEGYAGKTVAAVWNKIHFAIDRYLKTFVTIFGI